MVKEGSFIGSNFHLSMTAHWDGEEQKPEKATV